MGVAIRDILADCKETLTWGDLPGIAAVDAHNALYQFLSIIRQPDGTPLMNGAGRVTSPSLRHPLPDGQLPRERHQTGLCF